MIQIRKRQGGFTLVEVIVSVVIVASGFIPLMMSLGGASDHVVSTILHRKLRYLMQIQIGDIERGETKPGEEEERYEEGSSGNFDAFSSEDYPDEYEKFEYVVEKLQEVIIVGGDDEKTLIEAGFSTDSSGNALGRPVTNDLRPDEEQAEEPEGIMKRVVVVVVRRLGETADDDISIRVMTYLPVPGEEEAEAGRGAEGAGAGEPGISGAAGKGGAPPPPGGGGGGDRK